MLKVIVDAEGYFLREDVEESLFEGESIVEKEPPKEGYDKPKFVGGEWIEGGTPNNIINQSTDEKLADMAVKLYVTQTQLQDAQGALDFLIMGGI